MQHKQRLLGFPWKKRLFKQQVKFYGMEYGDELHKDFRKSPYLLKVKAFHKDDIWSTDLIEMPKQHKYKYILTVIDLFTKFA